VQSAGLAGARIVGLDAGIRGVTLDSRSVTEGDLFFALPGEARHGADFAADAAARGAAAILSDRPRPNGLPGHLAWVEVENARAAAGRIAREYFGRPDEALTLVGVTGTNGKTTVTFLIEAIASAAGRKAGRIGTNGATFTGREHPLARTTPEATDLYRILAEMRDAGVELVAMEVSSHALVLERVAGARFAVACLVSFGRDHLDFHGTRERYLDAKAILFERLAGEATAVLPADDPAGDEIARRTRAKTVRFGRAAAATIRITRDVYGTHGSRGVLETAEGPLAFTTPLVGAFNVDNVAAAAACALAAGCASEAVVRGVAALAIVPGRLEPIDLGQPFAVLVDYAHTPEAIRTVLATLRGFTRGRMLIVFGCGGNRDQGKRPEMGRAAAEGADRIFVTTDNPRSEDPAAIARAAEAGAHAVAGGAARTRVILDRSAAIAAAIGEARAGDAVLIAGKGHETVQEIGDRRTRLDDRELARDALAALGYRAGGTHASA